MSLGEESLLDVQVGSPLLRERRLASTAGGEPVEYSDDRYRPDIVSFSIQNSESAIPRSRG
jgi:GntR family transcriptional regulator